MEEIPVFDHTKDATQISGPNGKYLEQEGHKFTFAEFQFNTVQTGTDIDGNPIFERKGGTWVPEPQHIPPSAEAEVDEVKNLLTGIYDMLKKVTQILPALEIYTSESIMRNRANTQSFNELKGKLGVMRKKLNEYEKERKLVSKRAELKKLEEGLEEDGE